MKTLIIIAFIIGSVLVILNNKNENKRDKYKDKNGLDRHD